MVGQALKEAMDKVDWPAAQRALSSAASHPAVQQVGAATLQLVTSCSAYSATLAVAHVGAGCLRIHTATPLLGTLGGLAAVSAASVAAGHVSRATLAALQAAGGDLRGTVLLLPHHLLHSWRGGEAAVDAVLGPLVYRFLLRHDFRRLLPSHLAKPGAFGFLHVPTGAAEYATAAEKAQLSVLFGRDGCHHCGTLRNGVIGDHMPPYKVVRDAVAAREAAGGLEKLLRRAADALGLKDNSLKQVYFAQCRDCSGRQAQLMRNGTRATLLPGGLWPPELVLHAPQRLAARPSLPALLVGSRYYVDAAVAAAAAGGRRPGGGGTAAEAEERGGGGKADSGGRKGSGRGGVFRQDSAAWQEDAAGRRGGLRGGMQCGLGCDHGEGAEGGVAGEAAGGALCGCGVWEAAQPLAQLLPA
ncbi:hypothetical protein HXX76_015609 [Chlamydomonas incerta]|uniref:Uncharacterized protein n=1 Tax=Chlamydomonas incerta TaxID=51695 RepID=A0A835VRR9_CHLIN|nr:hypothetical protein HXX76_015609 [Chlamydomonas incerta]|eukprot:KAG2423011.1 hypothetical protein HXX76_015609 [Chlamydomonas incerta]